MLRAMLLPPLRGRFTCYDARCLQRFRYTYVAAPLSTLALRY